MEQIIPGIWRLRVGTPEAITPVAYQEIPPRRAEIESLLPAGACPIPAEAIAATVSARGTLLEIPVAAASPQQQFYGLGLQLGWFNPTGRKRTLRVNSDPTANLGDSHAPVPFLVSTAGYGILVDTARYATIYIGSQQKKKTAVANDANPSAALHDSTSSLYETRAADESKILIEIPVAQGVDLYLFAGPTMAQAVQRYNLFSGGGCLPAMWGLGVWYRAYTKANQADALAMAKRLRDSHLPCDVLGLEPGWQTRAYSCSFKWSDERFPDPAAMIEELKAADFKVNLWEHAFVHPESPLHPPLAKLSGDYEVWNGLVPDLLVPEARKTFTDYHATQLVDQGITGFKLDECDNSDFIENSSWSFPEASKFPSGADGEQMHTMIGLQYQRSINDAIEQAGVRTFSSVRSSGALAAPYPFVLYSDLYDHRSFIRGVAVSGFSGLLWSPEVRDAVSEEDLLRRIETVVLSPLACINAWYIKNPPWLQFDREKNNADELLADASALEESVRKLLRLRMMLVPYLYAAFANYYFEGRPPFRALVMDHPADPATYGVDDQFLIGDELLAAPLVAGQRERSVYLPKGDWYHVFDRRRFEGGRSHAFAGDAIPLFARSGAIIPLAEPVEAVASDTVFGIVAHAFGPASELRPAMLFEDDGVGLGYRNGDFNRVTIRPDRGLSREGQFRGVRYRLTGWRGDD